MPGFHWVEHVLAAWMSTSWPVSHNSLWLWIFCKQSIVLLYHNSTPKSYFLMPRFHWVEHASAASDAKLLLRGPKDFPCRLVGQQYSRLTIFCWVGFLKVLSFKWVKKKFLTFVFPNYPSEYFSLVPASGWVGLCRCLRPVKQVLDNFYCLKGKKCEI